MTLLHHVILELCSFYHHESWTMLHVVKVQDGRKATTPNRNGHGREEDIDLLLKQHSEAQSI
jgi:hypothetical protein